MGFQQAPEACRHSPCWRPAAGQLQPERLPNEKNTLFVIAALENFTSEAETKGKTNQKNSDAAPGTGSVRRGERKNRGLLSWLNLV